MNCEHYSEWLGEAVDGNLRVDRQGELDAHCRECAACRELLNDLREIRAAAATLDRYTPSPATWQAIAAKIQRPRGAYASWALLAGSPMRALAAAATLALVLGAAAWFGLALRDRSAQREQAAADLARSAASELQMAEQHYMNAIASLELLTVKKDSSLDPAVAAEIAASLASIDRAINDSRAALKAEPDSFIAQTSLLEALRTKVALLQETVSLMNARS
jgi:predicted anti-sigma-YlaC factor YlaD